MNDLYRGLSTKRRVGTFSSPLFWLIAGNAVLRVAWILYMHPPQIADFDWYFTHAVQLAHGQGYIWGGNYTAYWPMGWPYFLSLILRVTGPHVMPGMFANATLSILIVCLIYRTAVQVFQSNAVALCAAIGYSLLPSQVQWNSVLGSEELFTFLLLSSLYIYVKTTKVGIQSWFRATLFSGLLLGLACDVRPLPLLFPGFILIYEWFVQRRGWGNSVKRAATMTIGMCIGILPMTLRNLVRMHHFILVSTNGGVNLWQGTQTDNGYYWPWDATLNPLLAAHGNEILQNQIGKHLAMQQIIWHPIITLNHGWLKICALYKDDTNAVWYTMNIIPHSGGTLWAWDWIDIYAYWAFMALAGLGLIAVVLRKCQNTRSLVFLLSFCLYYTLVFLFFPAWDRFRYPLMPIYALLSGLGTCFVFIRRYREQDFHRSSLTDLA
jgi:hypothetical protein